MNGPGYGPNPHGSGFPGYPGGGLGDGKVPTPFTTENVLQWEGSAEADEDSVTNGRFATWATPIFDLRPEYGTVPSQFTPALQGAQKIYNAMQKQLLVQITIKAPPGALEADLAGCLTGLNISCFDEANPWNTQDMRVVTPEQDVTSQFTTASELRGKGPITTAQGISGLGFFSPPSSVLGPVRFWRWNIILRFHIQHPFDPLVAITAGYY